MGMKYLNEIPDTFLAQHTYDETVINNDPSRALLDCNPHKVGRNWRLIKKFEREMICFDEERFLADNHDEETLELIEQIKNAEQPFASFLAMCGMQSLDLTAATDFNISSAEFHLNMAIVFDVVFAIMAEKRFLLYQDYNMQTSAVNIIKMSQTLSSFTDPNLWSTPAKRYQAYGVSAMRRYVTFGCFRNYDLGMQAIKDIFLACCSIGHSVFATVLIDFKNLIEEQDELDLRWVSTCVLEDAIIFCQKMSAAASIEGSAVKHYFAEFIDAVGALLSEGPTQLS